MGHPPATCCPAHLPQPAWRPWWAPPGSSAAWPRPNRCWPPPGPSCGLRRCRQPAGMVGAEAGEGELGGYSRFHNRLCTAPNWHIAGMWAPAQDRASMAHWFQRLAPDSRVPPPHHWASTWLTSAITTWLKWCHHPRAHPGQRVHDCRTWVVIHGSHGPQKVAQLLRAGRQES